MAQNASKHRTMFIGFSSDQQRLARLLVRMARAKDSSRGTLTRYTMAVSATYHFVPSVEARQQFASTDDE